MIDLDGRRAVITGASRGIGYAVAEAYANAGAEVHIVSESGDIEEAAAVLRSSANASLTGHVGDVSDRLVRRLAERHSGEQCGPRGIAWIDDQSPEVPAREDLPDQCEGTPEDVG